MTPSGGGQSNEGTLPRRDARPVEIWEHALDEGEHRLERNTRNLSSTGLVGGVDVMIGVAVFVTIASALDEVMPETTATALGALGFGIGFVFITIGRSELFTENFLVPVASVFERRASIGQLARVWGVTLVANLVGLFLLAVVMAQNRVLDHEVLGTAGALADVHGDREFSAAFLSAILAGTVMTLWTWLNAASESHGAKIAIALLVGFVLAAPGLNHVVVSTGEMMFGVLGEEARAGWGDVWQNFGVALLGNLVGGFGFVTIARLVQARGDED